jgi:leucyl aminopeptidase
MAAIIRWKSITGNSIMLAKLQTQGGLPAGRELARAKHLLIVAPAGTAPSTLPLGDTLARALSRRGKKILDAAVSAQTPDGALAVWVAPDLKKSVFEQQTAMRKAVVTLLAEHPEEITVLISGPGTGRRALAELAAHVLWVNGTPLPERKKKSPAKPLRTIRLCGHKATDGFAQVRAVAEGNQLCRELTVLPPNELTPGAYRQRLRKIAREYGWTRDEYDYKR